MKWAIIKRTLRPIGGFIPVRALILILGLLVSGALASQPDPLGPLIREQLTYECPKPGEPSFKAADSQPLVSEQAKHRLEAAWVYYRALAERGGWQQIAPGPVLAVGQEHPQIERIRNRLILTDDFDPPIDWRNVANPGLFDAPMLGAVRRFQRRHGLSADGIVGRQTLAAMNVPVTWRVAQLAVNLQRVRAWQAAVTEQRYVLVNIPAYELTAVQDGVVQLVSPVIVGRTDRQTPALSTSIRAINFHPTWYVPSSIVRRDLFPKLGSNPSYFVTENFILSKASDGLPVDPLQPSDQALTSEMLRLRQLPGPGNALGMIRLDMPNPYSVYLHDTSAPELFARQMRDLSSGCVRVRRIVDLAIWLLAAQHGWREQTVNQVLRDGMPQTVFLDQPVAVHFIYLTAWAQQDGAVHFRQDIYGRDTGAQRAQPLIRP